MGTIQALLQDYTIERLYNFVRGIMAHAVMDAFNRLFKYAFEFIIFDGDVLELFSIKNMMLPIAVVSMSLMSLLLVIDFIKIRKAGKLSQISWGEYTLNVTWATFVLVTFSAAILPLFLKANALLTRWIIEFDNYTVDTIANKIADTDVVAFNLDYAVLGFLFTALIMVIAFLINIIVSCIRLGDLAFLFLAAAPFAATIPTQNSKFGTFFTESIIIVFTQSLQALCMRLMISGLFSAMTVGGSLALYASAIGGSALLIKGPKVVRRMLYSTGAGQASTMIASQAGSMALMRKFVFKG